MRLTRHTVKTCHLNVILNLLGLFIQFPLYYTPKIGGEFKQIDKSNI